VVDAGGAVDRCFNQVGQAGVDDFRRGTRQNRGYGNHRKFNRWITVNTNVLIADDAEQYQYSREHVGEHMPPDGKLG